MTSTITLITPPSPFLLDERVFVSLGILKVASILRDRGWIVEHVDLSGVDNYIDAVIDHMDRTASLAVGITTTTPQLPTVVKIARAIRAHRRDVRIILGGPHVTLTNAAVKLERKSGRVSRAHAALEQLQLEADVLVGGDGEHAIFEALKPDAPAIVDADDVKGPLFLTNAKYEASPLPARELVNLSTYHYEIEGRQSTSLIAQLGCPFGCGFCGGRNSQSLRVIRTRSVASIVGEVRQLHEQYGYRGFMFYDDELNVSRTFTDLMNALADLQGELGVDFRLRGFVKAELLTPEQATAMHRAGFRWVLTGFESGSPRILQNINKKATLDDNTRAVAIAKRAGLKVKALMSIGHPGESEATVQETRDWLLSVQPDDFDCTVITTYPGTPYYDEAVRHESLPDVWTYTYPKNGDRLHAFDVDFLRVADYYKGDPDGGYTSYVFTDYLQPEEIVRLRNWVENSVRTTLGIAYPCARASVRYEHSMGQGANLALPPFIFASSAPGASKATIASGSSTGASGRDVLAKRVSLER